MEKVINVYGKDLKLKTNAGLIRRYRQYFRRDLVQDMEIVIAAVDNAAETGGSLSVEALEIFENLAYSMNKFADPEQPDNIDDWLAQFETFDIYTVFPEILALWTQDNEQLSDAKKKYERPPVK